MKESREREIEIEKGSGRLLSSSGLNVAWKKQVIATSQTPKSGEKSEGPHMPRRPDMGVCGPSLFSRFIISSNEV